jgi:hypothetical protein
MFYAIIFRQQKRNPVQQYPPDLRIVMESLPRRNTRMRTKVLNPKAMPKTRKRTGPETVVVAKILMLERKRNEAVANKT